MPCCPPVTMIAHEKLFQKYSKVRTLWTTEFCIPKSVVLKREKERDTEQASHILADVLFKRVHRSQAHSSRSPGRTSESFMLKFEEGRETEQASHTSPFID